MRITAFISLFTLSLVCQAGDIIHPMDFTGSENEKSQVISFIKATVQDTYSAIGMDDPLTLRTMEQEELKSFKQLTKVKNRVLLDNVIEQYCGIGMCNYNAILMMYKEQSKAAEKELKW